MTQTLNDLDVDVVRKTVQSEITKDNRDAAGDRIQALGGILEIMLLQAIIPILVSLTSTVLTEIVKGRMLSSLKRREAEEAIQELKKRNLKPKADLDDECMSEMRRLLTPLGLSDKQIKELYQSAKQQVELHHSN